MKLWSLILVAALVLAGNALALEPRGRGAAKVEARPLTYANVVSFFRKSGLHPTEVQKRCTVFFEGEWKNADVYNYCLIVVENSDEDIQVTFYVTDAHEMNWITEFVDAPFFARAETEKLFELVNAHRETHAENLGRHRVDFHHWRPRHADIFVFSFTPARAAR